jgi:hypothetical protein
VVEPRAGRTILPELVPRRWMTPAPKVDADKPRPRGKNGDRRSDLLQVCPGGWVGEGSHSSESRGQLDNRLWRIAGQQPIARAQLTGSA